MFKLIGIKFPNPKLLSISSENFIFSLFPFNNSNLVKLAPINFGLFEYKLLSQVSNVSSILMLFPFNFPWSHKDKVE